MEMLELPGQVLGAAVDALLRIEWICDPERRSCIGHELSQALGSAARDGTRVEAGFRVDERGEQRRVDPVGEGRGTDLRGVRDLRRDRVEVVDRRGPGDLRELGRVAGLGTENGRRVR